MRFIHTAFSIFIIAKKYLAGPAILLVPVLAMSAGGCDDDADEMTLRFDTESNKIEVVFSDDDSRYGLTCSEYIEAYRTKNGARGAAVGSDFDSLDRERGYVLDGELIPPRPSDGCDAIMCFPFEGMTGYVPLTEYHLEGTHILTEAEKAVFDASVPESFTTVDEVNVYTTSTYSGVVEVELTYYTTEECYGESAEAKTEVQRISVE